MKFFDTLKVYLVIAVQATWKSRHYTRQLLKELKKELGLSDEVFTAENRKRIRFYILQAIIVADWISTLRNTQLSQQQMKRTVYLGAVTPILDDLTDDLQLTSKEILQKIRSHVSKEDPGMMMAKYLLGKLITTSNEYFRKILVEALEAQDRSILQVEKEKLSDGELEKITRDKGGLFTLLYTVVLDDSLKAGEAEAIKELGYAMQQLNDMFDIYKDHKNGVQTLYTNSKNLYINGHTYTQTVNKIVSDFYQLDYNKKDIRKCLLKIAAILGRGKVCMDQLTALQEKSNEFSIQNFSRKQVICDMEKPANLVKSFRYSKNLIK